MVDFFLVRKQDNLIRVDALGTIFIKEIAFKKAAICWELCKLLCTGIKKADYHEKLILLPTNTQHHLSVVPGTTGNKDALSLRSFLSGGGQYIRK